MRRLTDQEGQRLQQIVRRGSASSVRYRRTMTWKESPDSEGDAKLDRIEEVLDRSPDGFSPSKAPEP